MAVLFQQEEGMRKSDAGTEQRNPSQADTEENTGGGISWQKLLDTIEAKGNMRADQMQTGSQVKSARHLQHSRQTKQPEYQDEEIALSHREEEKRFFQLQETLYEEVKELRNPVDALNWMEEHIFSATNPEALINKIIDTANPPSSALLKLYPYLLTDLSDMLRSTSPHASLLPLKLASSHSPISYMHGCTASLYASTMKTRWQVWGDVEGCLELLEEMQRGAVNHNHKIVDIVSKISDAISADTLRAREATAALPTPVDSEHTNNPSNLTTSIPTLNSKEARERERAAESKMFFAPAQRRALMRMEELVIEHRRRLGESLRKQDMLEDIIKQRERAGGENTSVVNALVNSYGQPGYLRASQPHQKDVQDAQKYYYDEGLRAPVPSTQSAAVEMPSSIEARKQAASNEDNDQILAQAVSEAAARKPRTVSKTTKTQSKKPKGKKGIGSKLHGQLSAERRSTSPYTGLVNTAELLV